ncbi:hypothetical protein GCM10023321_37060 [Pseudonocardia eucalypti]|uniref:Uncharacterized protein n=1 Tax=Pseudonocardia eucalypti TaxID=648755 RepID=A0ABP9Q957_9PSEU
MIASPGRVSTRRTISSTFGSPAKWRSMPGSAGVIVALAMIVIVLTPSSVAKGGRAARDGAVLVRAMYRR